MSDSSNDTHREPARALMESGANELDDCWNRIGVAGDSSCAELTRVVHCRNCPVYSAAGTRLLDRPALPEYRREWTEHFASAKAEAAPGKISAVVFRLGDEWLALPTRVFLEIVECRAIHSLPDRRNSVVLGVVNLRGELLVCVSLEKLIGLKPTPKQGEAEPSNKRLMVTEWQKSILVFPVDGIHGIQRYHPEELKPVPATMLRGAPALMRGLLTWGNRQVGCLDDDVAFSTLNRSLA